MTVMVMKRKVMMFSVGAFGYGLLEILWRGHTHWSMPIAGGVCFSSFGLFAQKLKKAGLLLKGLAGGAFITAVEFLFGVFFNLILKKNVWDYSNLPFHLFGQICPRYAGLWALLSTAVMPLAGKLYRQLGTEKNYKRGDPNGFSVQNLGGD